MIRAAIFQRLDPATAAASSAQPEVLWPHDVTPYCDAISCSTNIWGGFERATITIKTSWQEMWRWYNERLGAHIELYDFDGQTVFEGMLWTISLSLGSSVYEVGLENMYSRTRVEYSEIIQDPAGNAVDRNGIEITSAQDNTDAQALYGIKEMVNRAGDYDANMANSSNIALYASAFRPDTIPGNVKLPNSGQPSMTVTAMGYYNTLNYRLYTNWVDTLATPQVQIREIIDGADNPGGGELWAQFIDNTTVEHITASTIANVARECRNRLTVRERIEKLSRISGLGPDFARYFFQVWDHRIAYGNAVPYSTTYETNPISQDNIDWHIELRRSKVYDKNWNERAPHLIRAGDVAEIIDVPLRRNGLVIAQTAINAGARSVTLGPLRGELATEEMYPYITLME